MRNLVLLFMPVVLLYATDKPQRANKAPARTAKAPATRSAASAPTTIPAGAVEIQPFLFRHTGTDGKVWLYRKTPFGITKAEEKVRDTHAKDAAAVQHVRVIDRGETVRFERPTPMGTQSWEKKRIDLTSEEKAWLEKNTQASARPEK